MLSAGMLAVTVFLSATVDEPTRESRGVSNPAFTTPRDELEFLRKNKPSLEGGGAALGAGATISAVGAGMIILSFALEDRRGGVRNEGQVFGVLIGGGIFGLGALIGIIGGIVMGSAGDELTRVNARIRVLEGQVEKLQVTLSPSGLIARF